MPGIRDNFKNICLDIDTIKKENNLKNDTCLIAVSKSQSVEKIEELIKSGHDSFGENRVQEAIGKWKDLKKSYPYVKLHMIGHLQTNKVKEVLSLFDFIHTVDSCKLIDCLLEQTLIQKKQISCFIQINIGREKQKSGILPDQLSDILSYSKSKNFIVKGLMCIPPAKENPAVFFEELSLLAKMHNLSWLSMGMSADYKAAIISGATHLRVGRSIFSDEKI